MIKNYFAEKIGEFFYGLWQVIYGASYWVALILGLVAILFYICGHKGALKWIWTSIIGYVVISALGGL